MSKEKFNISMEPETKEWCKQQAEYLGISLSGMINVAVAQYRQQQESVKTANNMPDLVKTLLELFSRMENEAGMLVSNGSPERLHEGASGVPCGVSDES
jgi:hypothetical protein